MKHFRAYLDRPGGGWMEFLKARSLEEARSIVDAKHTGYDRADTVEEVPADCERKTKKLEALHRANEKAIERIKSKSDRELNKLEREYNRKVKDI